MARPRGAKARLTPPDCHPDREHHAGGLCGSCYNSRRRRLKPDAYQRWYKRNNERIKTTTREYKFVARYGITKEQRDSLIAKQNGLCVICKCELSGLRNVHTDHCHDTGKIRGILCRACNMGLGHFQHKPELLRSAAEYLK